MMHVFLVTHTHTHTHTRKNSSFLESEYKILRLHIMLLVCVERTGQEMVHGPGFFSTDNIPHTANCTFWSYEK